MGWEKFLNNITKEKPSSFFEISDREYLEKWIYAVEKEWITKNSQITSLGYAIYVITCLCLNKTSMFGGPLVKSKSASRSINIESYNIVEIDPFKNEYSLGNQGPGIMTVLVKCIRGYGSPSKL